MSITRRRERREVAGQADAVRADDRVADRQRAAVDEQAAALREAAVRDHGERLIACDQRVRERQAPDAAPDPAAVGVAGDAGRDVVGDGVVVHVMRSRRCRCRLPAPPRTGTARAGGQEGRSGGASSARRGCRLTTVLLIVTVAPGVKFAAAGIVDAAAAGERCRPRASSPPVTLNPRARPSARSQRRPGRS